MTVFKKLKILTVCNMYLGNRLDITLIFTFIFYNHNIATYQLNLLSLTIKYYH